MSSVIYAIGDIHGDFVQLRAAHARVASDIEEHGITDYSIVHVGDLVDRREDSKGVVEYLMNGHRNGEPWIMLKGNHDRLFHWFMEDPHRADPRLRADYNWLHPRMGGRDTLASYGVKVAEEYDLGQLHAQALKAVPSEHITFLQSLPSMYEADAYVFVHAGIRPGVPLAKQTEDDLVWIRNEFLRADDKHPKIVVHGHTPVDDVQHHGNRINIDTGAAWGHRLSTIALVGRDAFVLDGDRRVPLLPQSGFRR